MGYAGQESGILAAGTLWSRIREQTELALRTGALQAIETEVETIEEKGIRFIVRILSNLEPKTRARRRQSRTGRNPFLPCNPDLLVGNLSTTHFCLLNRFCILEHHLLIVTRAFEEQERPLNRSDFEALSLCLAEIDGLGFYNSGRTAGASQPHKHLQLIPLPLGPGPGRFPFQPVLKAHLEGPAPVHVPTLPFLHLLSPLEADLWNRPGQVGEALLARYETLRSTLELDRDQRHYNLLATREWMLLAPRRQESFEGISVNAIGFAGGLLVRNRTDLERLKRHGPLTVLRKVGVPPPETEL